MPSARSKGLNFCREVKRLLEGMNHTVEGPGYRSAFFGGKVNAIHQDYFGIWDLISFCDGEYIFHQVSTIENKAQKVKQAQAQKMPGWVWCRTSEDGRTKYRLFFVQSDGTVEEGEIRFLH